jgi:hypothetical protein
LKFRSHARLDGLGDGTDLVDLEEETVAGRLLDGHLDALGVGDRKVVADHLDLGGLVEVDPRGEVVLVEGVLDRANVILLNVWVVEGSELLAGDPLGLVRVGVLRQSASVDIGSRSETHLEVEVVLAVLVELGRGNVEADLDLASVAGLLDGLGEEVEGLLGTRDVGSETTLVTDVGSCDTVSPAVPCATRTPAPSRPPRAVGSLGLTVNAVFLRDDLLEGVVDLSAHLHGLGERLGAGGEEHELLEGEGVTGVGSTVDDVKGRAGEDEGGLDTGNLGEVLVEGNALGGRCQLIPRNFESPLEESVDFGGRKQQRLTLSAAAASETAMETARMALAPSLALLGVPSSLIKRSSTSFCEVTARPDLMSSGAMMSLTFLTAVRTPARRVEHTCHRRARERCAAGEGKDGRAIEGSNDQHSHAADTMRVRMLTLAHVLLGLVTELDGLVDTGRSAGRDLGAEEALLGVEVDLDGGVACDRQSRGSKTGWVWEVGVGRNMKYGGVLMREVRRGKRRWESQCQRWSPLRDAEKRRAPFSGWGGYVA